jgi:aryl-alcohol dehydrogenase-like predicted oxidoreductase
MALSFTLAVEGVMTAIVGTTKPGRYEENASFLNAEMLSNKEFQSIRDRWIEMGGGDWTGQV